jgi:enoyl-CoA hydratase/carnithine racemase
VPVSTIDGELFSSSSAAKTALIDRATVSVSQLVDQAVAKAQEWYPSGRERQSNDPLALIIKQEATVPVTKEHPTGQIRPELAELAAELQQEAQEVAMVELPEGMKAKVRSIKLPEVLK